MIKREAYPPVVAGSSHGDGTLIPCGGIQYGEGGCGAGAIWMRRERCGATREVHRCDVGAVLVRCSFGCVRPSGHIGPSGMCGAYGQELAFELDWLCKHSG